MPTAFTFPAKLGWTTVRHGGAYGDNECLLNVPVCPAVNSVLAIGGVGGLAIGLAGREILENLFTGLIILSSSPFEVGEEVLFTPPSGPVRSVVLAADAACAALAAYWLLVEVLPCLSVFGW